MGYKTKSFFITPYYDYRGDINASLNTIFIDAWRNFCSITFVITSSYSKSYSCNVIKLRYSKIGLCILQFIKKYYPKIKFNLLPDTFHWIWENNAIRTSVKCLENNKIDYLHSISVPYSSHLVALKLKKRYNIPWIAHFYEPWCDNTYRKSTPYVMRKNEEWEREVAMNADVIIHNSEVMCEKWHERYGKLVEGKLFYLPMPLTDASKIISKGKGEKLVISHIGNFYGIRNSTVFLEALNNCLIQNPSLKDKLRVNFIGLYTDLDIETVNRFQLNDVVNFVGKITEEECVEYYNSSDIFLVIEGKDQGPLFFPSKLIKYLYYEKPIIGITETDSVLDKQLKNNGHYSYTHEDIKGITEYIERAVNSYDSLLSFKKDAWKEFEISNVIKIYKSIVDKLLQNNNLCPSSKIKSF